MQSFELGKHSKDTSVYNAMLRAYAYEGEVNEAEVRSTPRSNLDPPNP